MTKTNVDIAKQMIMNPLSSDDYQAVAEDVVWVSIKSVS